MLFRLKALKWYIICHSCCLVWGPKPVISLRNSFVFYRFLKCSVSHISFRFLATCRLFCENMSHIFYQITNSLLADLGVQLMGLHVLMLDKLQKTDIHYKLTFSHLDFSERVQVSNILNTVIEVLLQTFHSTCALLSKTNIHIVNHKS